VCNCPTSLRYNKYVTGHEIRQRFLDFFAARR